MNSHSKAAAPSPMSRRAVRISLLLIALLASAVPFTHYRFIYDHLNGVRYPWGLLPAEFLFFRWFGDFSGWFPAAFLAAFGWSFYRPESARHLLIIGTVAFLLFIVTYLCYSLVIAFILLQRNA